MLHLRDEDGVQLIWRMQQVLTEDKGYEAIKELK
jgi:hypothetical protein